VRPGTEGRGDGTVPGLPGLDPVSSMRALQSLGTWATEHDLMNHLAGPPRQIFFTDPTTAAADTPVSDLVGPLLPN
jgi:hypothetical protein